MGVLAEGYGEQLLDRAGIRIKYNRDLQLTASDDLRLHRTHFYLARHSGGDTL